MTTVGNGFPILPDFEATVHGMKIHLIYVTPRDIASFMNAANELHKVGAHTCVKEIYYDRGISKPGCVTLKGNATVYREAKDEDPRFVAAREILNKLRAFNWVMEISIDDEDKNITKPAKNVMLGYCAPPNWDSYEWNDVSRDFFPLWKRIINRIRKWL